MCARAIVAVVPKLLSGQLQPVPTEHEGLANLRHALSVLLAKLPGAALIAILARPTEWISTFTTVPGPDPGVSHKAVRS